MSVLETIECIKEITWK